VTTGPIRFAEIPVKELMQRRIQEVLLVCSKYDKFILEEDGRVDEQIFQEYTTLNLRYPPRFTQVESAEQALTTLSERSYDLVISMLSVDRPQALQSVESIRRTVPDVPVVVLTPFTREVSLLLEDVPTRGRFEFFAWLGDDGILLAIIKLIEDRMNAAADVIAAGVQTIILVEDSVRYYSSFLPLIYRLLIQQARSIMDEGLNEWEQTMRMRCRPKILLARNWEEAVDLYDRFGDHTVGVISDITFPRGGAEDPTAGLELGRRIRARDPNLPVLLQSSDPKRAAEAKVIDCGFLHKDARGLHVTLRRYIRRNYGFGSLRFTDPVKGSALETVKDLQGLQALLRDIDPGSYLHHLRRGDVTRWLRTRALFPPADRIDAELREESDAVAARDRSYEIITAYRRFVSSGTIARFDRERYDEYLSFARIGDGSLGGKGRGLAFIDLALKRSEIIHRYEGITVSIPRTVVLSTSVFQDFVERNAIADRIDPELKDDDILDLFVSGSFSEDVRADLRTLLEVNRSPLAVRSSSLLEDSLSQPFAGIYATYLLPNISADIAGRLADLETAIKAVYASTWYKAARDYMAATGNLITEEMMAVVIQELVGTCHDQRCYPSIAGIARSLNYYPVEDERPEDGVAQIAIGLGAMVVEGGAALRFSPRHPRSVPQLSDAETAVRTGQKTLYALDLSRPSFVVSTDDATTLIEEDLEVAREDPSFPLLVSSWDFENGMLRDGYREGAVPVPTFAGILKHGRFPLAEILQDLLGLAEREMGVPVEIEFAVDLNPGVGRPAVFSFLQVRPIVEGLEADEIELDRGDAERAIVYSCTALGNGVSRDLEDLIYVRPDRFDPARSREIAETIGGLNTELGAESRRYVLIVPGRLGSRDPWLGIPTQWYQVSNARAIVEVTPASLNVESSQGSHFFHNITALRIAYLTVDTLRNAEETVDFDWLDQQEARFETDAVRYLRFDRPLVAKIAGAARIGAILPPEDSVSR